MSKQKLLAGLAIVSFAGTIVVNALANLLPINGLNTGEVSNRYPNLFTPDGATFLIWNVIYLLLAGFVILAWSRRHLSVVQQVLPWFIGTNVLNMTWICVATIANAAALLVSYRWQGGPLSPEAWTVMMMIVAASLALFMAWRYQAPAFILVVMWALLGIYLRWRHTEFTGLIYSAMALILALGAAFIAISRKRREVNAGRA